MSKRTTTSQKFIQYELLPINYLKDTVLDQCQEFFKNTKISGGCSCALVNASLTITIIVINIIIITAIIIFIYIDGTLV